MFCYKCGKNLDSEVSFCPVCGADLRNPMSTPDDELKIAVERFISGDANAFEDVYAKSNRYIYYTILKTVSDRDAADDILQDTYLEIYNNLHSLRSIDAFKGWAAKVAQSRISRYFAKNKELLFSTEEEMDDSIEGEIEDDKELIPEDAIQDKESARLLLNIIDSLPAAQREAIVAYYYNQMSIAEIAGASNMSENTVKTNLRRGKERIKTGVLELEKKHGTKLYATIPFAIAMHFLFGQDAKACTLPADGLAKVAAAGSTSATGATAAGSTGTAGAATNIATIGAAASGAASGSAAGAGMAFGIKLAIGIVVGALLIGGGAAAYMAVSSGIDKMTDLAVEQEMENTEEIVEEVPEETESEEEIVEEDLETESSDDEGDVIETEDETEEESESGDEPESEPEPEPEPEPTNEIDISKLYTTWTLPGFGRYYMEFSDNGTVWGYDYPDNKIEINGNKLTIKGTNNGDENYIIVRLDENWMGLQAEGSSETVWSYRADGPLWEVDPELLNSDYDERWVATDFAKASDFAGGFQILKQEGMVNFEQYLGEPNVPGDTWDMASTVYPGAVSAKNGEIKLFETPDSFTSMSYNIDVDGVLHIKDKKSGKEYDYVRALSQW